MNKQILYFLGLLLATTSVVAQSEYRMKTNADEVDANFLMGYYQQDGNNAAVTGGIGTEELQDVATMIVVNVPLDSIKALTINLGADYYTSASTDNIDNHVSSASVQDVRTYGNFGYVKKNINRGETYSIGIGFSTEYDYTSVSGRASYAREWNEGNSELSLTGQAFFDNWSLIFPVEIRQQVGGTLAGSGRNSFNLQAGFAQVLSQRLQVLLSTEAIYMTGLLSTPFHRVYFSDQNAPDIERLPDNRLKIPLSIRLNYFPADFLVLRTNYRYYWDDFGITAHTIEVEAPLKLSPSLTLSPFYRYHTQSASTYFAPYAQHTTNELFYTSDYDLSALDSHKIGLGLSISPIYGIGRFKLPLTKRIVVLDKLLLRSAYYDRSTGLTGFLISLDVGMKIK
jgi:hypothetical protein